MKPMKSYNITEELLEEIISVAYGNAGFFTRKRINKLAQEYKEVADLLNQYRETAEELKQLKPEECPAEIIDEVNRKIREEKSQIGIIQYIYARFIEKPVFSAATVTILVLAIAIGVINRESRFNDYSKAEVEAAEVKVRQSLAIVSNMFKQTTNTIKKDILSERVGKELNEGINVVNYLLKENKNENTN